MSDPFAVLKWAQNRGQQQSPLSVLGQGIGEVGQQLHYNKLEGQYNEALETALTNPTNENISALYQIAEPLGRFANARAAINDLFGRMPEAVGPDGTPVNPDMAAYDQALEAWRADPTNEDRQVDLYDAASRVDMFDEAQDIVNDVVGNRQNQAYVSQYDAAIEAYQQDPSPENYQLAVRAAEPLGYGDTARQTMDSMDQQRTRAEQARIQLRREKSFEEAQEAYRRDRSPANFDAMYQASLPLGYFDEMQEYVSTLSTEERQQDVVNAMTILAPLSIRDTQKALESVNRFLSVADTPEEVQAFEQMKELLENNRIEEAQDTLYQLLGMSPEGRDLLGNLYEMNKDRRAQAATAEQLIATAHRLEFDTDEQRQAFLEAADGLPYPLASAIAEFGRVAVPDAATAGAARDRLLDREESLRKEMMGYIDSHLTVRNQLANIEAQYDLDNTSGMSDQAFVMLFNKVLDPDSVVRASEFATTAAAQAKLEAADAAIRGWFDSGQKLGPNARKDIVEAARAIAGISRQEIDKYRGLIQNTVDVIDPDGSLGSAPRIFRELQSEEDAARAFEAEIEAVVSANPEAGEEIRSAIRKEGITTPEGLDDFVGSGPYQEALQRYREARSEEVDRSGYEDL